MGKLDGKVAVVTGGSAGMSLATAKLFVREGARVIITGPDPVALDLAAREVGDGVDAFHSDIAVLADLDALHDHVERGYGRVDIVFANAGGGRPGAFEEVSEDDFDFTADTNFKGTFSRCRSSCP